jgi:conjugal transfer pilus assembly protein TraK
MMQTKTRTLPALLVSLGLLLPAAARADGTPASVDFGQPGEVSNVPVSAASPASGAPVSHKRYTAHTRTKSTRDPLKVDPSIAVKDTPRKEIDLPGVLHVQGQSPDILDPTKARRISWTNGGAQTIYLSVNEPNRIQLPFKNPYVIRMSDVTVDHRADSNNMYVYWNVTHSEDAQPREIYIEPPGGGSSLGLELVPKSIPGQTVIVTDDTGITAGHLPKSGDSGDYITHIQDLMTAVALGQSPDGFSQLEVHLPPIGMDGLSVTANVRYSSHEGDLWVYTVRNPGASRALLHEQEFDGPSVLAVSIFPKPLLLPGEQTKVFVLARKREEE